MQTENRKYLSDAKEAHVIKKLVVGETYTLREEFAPYGYLKATDIQFTVEDTLLRMLSAREIIMSSYLKPLIKLLPQILKLNHYFIVIEVFSIQVRYRKSGGTYICRDNDAACH